MREQHIPVGISDREIYIALVVDGEFKHFDGVLRPVSVEQLDYLRDMYERRDEYKDLWKEAVSADATEMGLDDWLEEIWRDGFE